MRKNKAGRLLWRKAGGEEMATKDEKKRETGEAKREEKDRECLKGKNSRGKERGLNNKESGERARKSSCRRE
eukprot:1085814-Amorphochlora_amoeboformis.AAC.2